MRGKKNNATPGEPALVGALCVVLRKRFAVAAGERLGVGVSGGADSVGLLRLMVEAQRKIGFVLCVAHFNHKLRGKASEADEKFVARLAAEHGLEFCVESDDVAALAKRERRNVEDAGRRARYGWFERLVKEGRLARVAVAHTADDQAETVLAHILRGTGIAGLGGIHPQVGCVFRPLLAMRRAELRAYLRSKRQVWLEDATNRDVTRTRARIRRLLLPTLDKKFNPAVVEHLCQLAELAREDDTWLEEETHRRLNEVSSDRPDGICIPVAELVDQVELAGETAAIGRSAFTGRRGHRKAAATRELDVRGSDRQTLPGSGPAGAPVPQRAHSAIAKRMVRLLVRGVKPQMGELGAQHVGMVLQLAAHGHSGQILQLPGNVEVRRERDTMVFRGGEPLSREQARERKRASNQQKNTKRARSAFALEVRLPATGEALRLAAPSRILHLRVIDWPEEGRETTEWRIVLDRVRLREPLVLRAWRAGDAMRPAGHQKRHTLARLLNELGRTRWEKEAWPVLESAGKVAWALGLPVAEEFAVAKDSRAGVVITEESAR
jgi:tRNA(Ile)-lysidine synthetase-like protein